MPCVRSIPPTCAFPGAAELGRDVLHRVLDAVTMRLCDGVPLRLRRREGPCQSNRLVRAETQVDEADPTLPTGHLTPVGATADQQVGNFVACRCPVGI